MRVAEEELPEMPGQDAFLDVLTNMVGIIILLVVVIGLRASRAAMQAATAEHAVTAAEAVDDSAQRGVAAAIQKTHLSEEELKSLVAQTVALRGETALRAKERDYLTTYITAFEQELSTRRSALSADKQQDFDLRRKLADAQLTLENLGREQVALLSAPAAVEAIENQPTPLAQRAAGNRVYMFLSGGRIATIPKELFDATSADLEENIWRIKNEPTFDRTVGPVGGFRLKYFVAMQAVRLRDTDPNVPGASRSAVMARPQLLWFEITPEAPGLGETVAEALAPNSYFRQTLRENPADATTLVIAVYPDSIRELHQLKKELYAQRYATADIPFKTGQPMKGVPTGSSMASRSGQVFAQ